MIDYAASLDFAADVYLTGHSQGGAAALLAAALKEDKLKAVILQAPAMLLKDASLDGKVLENKYDPEHVPEELSLNGRPVSGNYVRVNWMVPFEEAMGRIRGPIQVIHADSDEIVPFFYAQQIKDRIEHAELVAIPGDDHIFSKHVDLVVDAMLEFLKRN